jgi:NDP-sugar pyrophosphorylase family protein
MVRGSLKAVILAGGQGRRLKPLTDSTPKPLVEVAGRPIVAWQIEWLKRYGVEQFILSIGYLKEKFIEALGSGRRYGVHVSYVVEEEPLGTAGGLKNAKPLLDKEDAFYVLNGDIITDLDPSKLAEGLEDKAVGVIALIPMPSPYGVVDCDEKGYVKSFLEKPSLPHWINAGIYLFKPEIFDYMPEKGDLEKTVFPKLAEEGRLKAVEYKSHGFWKSIDTFKDVEDAEKLLKGSSHFERA